MMNGDAKIIIGELKANNRIIFKNLDRINARLDENGKILEKYVTIVNEIRKTCAENSIIRRKRNIIAFGYELKTIYAIIVLIIAYFLGFLSNNGIIDFAIKVLGGN